MINIVVPMAGSGSRFVAAGFTKPKPFIDVAGKPMIVRVLENLACPDARFILIARKEHMEAEPELVAKIERDFGALFIPIDKLTEGTVCTVLHARRHINNDEPLLIANSDQIVDSGIAAFTDDCRNRRLDGSILTFIDPYRDPKWSFARIGDDGLVAAVKEKVAISEHATVGIYLFAKGKYFVDGAIDMIIDNDRVNGEFYTCPVYNHAIADGRRIGIFGIDFAQMHGVGTPDDLAAYIATLAGVMQSLPVSR